jgi:hypothetical protein
VTSEALRPRWGAQVGVAVAGGRPPWPGRSAGRGEGWFGRRPGRSDRRHAGRPGPPPRGERRPWPLGRAERRWRAGRRPGVGAWVACRRSATDWRTRRAGGPARPAGCRLGVRFVRDPAGRAWIPRRAVLPSGPAVRWSPPAGPVGPARAAGLAGASVGSQEQDRAGPARAAGARWVPWVPWVHLTQVARPARWTRWARWDRRRPGSAAFWRAGCAGFSATRPVPWRASPPYRADPVEAPARTPAGPAPRAWSAGPPVAALAGPSAVLAPAGLPAGPVGWSVPDEELDLSAVGSRGPPAGPPAKGGVGSAGPASVKGLGRAGCRGLEPVPVRRQGSPAIGCRRREGRARAGPPARACGLRAVR